MENSWPQMLIYIYRKAYLIQENSIFHEKRLKQKD